MRAPASLLLLKRVGWPQQGPGRRDKGDAMGAWLQTQTFWLDLTNIVLGVVTLVCLLVVGFGLVQELGARRWPSPARDADHVLVTPELGLTMADGGHRIETPKGALSWRRRRG